MITCTLDFSKISPDRKKLYLECPGIGTYEVFSGDAPFTNRSECTFIKHSAIPSGKYWIVDRPTGPWRSKALTWAKSLTTGNDYSTWFALYRDDKSIDDHTFISGVERRNFRLHPLHPDGSGTSWGCVTFFRTTDFLNFRNSLVRVKKEVVKGTNLMAYGTLKVIGSTTGPCYVR